MPRSSIYLVLLLVWTTTAPSQVESSVTLEDKLRQSFLKVKNASVTVADGAGSFSAVIVDESGTILTAGHCVTPGAKYDVTMADGFICEARGLGCETRLDVGMLKLVSPKKDLPFVELGSSSILKKDDPCFGLSFPGDPDASRGHVLRFGRIVSTKNPKGFVHTTVLMEPGDSGGPLFDIHGRLIGIHSRIDGPEDDNYDVPIEQFVRFWTRLKEAKRFRLSSLIQEQLSIQVSDVKDGEGFAVQSLGTDSLAKSAGILVGDVVQSLNNRTMNSARQFRRELRRGARDSFESGLKLQVLRSGKTMNFSLDFKRLSRTPTTSLQPLAKNEKVISPQPIDEDIGLKQTVVIQSGVGAAQKQIAGTVVSDQGHIVTKSSEVRVDEAVTVRSDLGSKACTAKVVARDLRSDLVLLKVDRQFGGVPVRWTTKSSPVGSFLHSPVAENGQVVVGVTATHPYDLKAKFFIGVYLEEEKPGLAVKRVEKGMPASAAGMKKGDVIFAIGNKKIETRDDLRHVLSSLTFEMQLQFKVLRGTEHMIIPLTPTTVQRFSSGPDTHIADRLEGGFSERRTGFGSVFVSDSRIRASQCGGPTLLSDGSCVGLNIARRSRTQTIVIPSQVVREFLRLNLK